MIKKYEPVQKIDVMLIGKDYITMDDTKEETKEDIAMDMNSSEKGKTILVPDDFPSETKVQESHNKDVETHIITDILKDTS